VPPEDVAHALAKESGLQALAGTADMREVLEQDGLALGVYLHRLRAQLGTMVAPLDGLDALVFTGGTGENSPELRRRTVERLGWLGLRIDDERNAAATVDESTDHADVSAHDAPARTLVVHVREDLEAARQVRELFAGEGSAS
jgi:acetate kinase